MSVMDANLVDLLRLANPWLENHRAFPEAVAHRIPEPYIERRLPGAEAWPEPRKAHLLIGARQVGKSSFLWKRFRSKRTPPLWLNAEEASIRGWLSSATRVAADLADLVEPRFPLFIDEAQHLPDAGLLIKGLIDGGLPNTIYVTGSSAFHLMARTRESLAGRASRALMHPLSIEETTAAAGRQAPAIRAALAREQALRHAVVGGYPEVWTSGAPEKTLSHLLEAFVLRDASDLFRIQHLGAFRKLLLLVAGQIGSLVNVAEWASHCGVARETVDSYLDILVETHIVHRVEPFAAGKRAEVTHRPKVYFCDNGLRNIVARQFGVFAERVDRGALLENLVAAELRKRLTPLSPLDVIRYWRSTSGAEVDFVVERPGGLVGIEVKAADMKRPALTRSARSFIDAYHPSRFVVVNLSLADDARIGGTRVEWRPVETLADAGAWLH
jgi:predicted AAA+ superfamily ATPase